MRFDQLSDHDVAHGEHISTVLDELARHQRSPWDDDLSLLAGGVAFVTFAYDIDGVSMEIAKYARCFERIEPGLPIHCIAGNFGDKAGAVLDPNWHRFVLGGADGWDKWDGGTWFHQLFYEDLPPDSTQSSELAGEMWNQALSLADHLVAYLDAHDIRLLFTVNTNSNPGNVAFGLALVLASETTGVVVINNNHDFYWEGGKAGCKRNPGEQPGPRDHFFRNHDNEEFFAFFQRIYPWNGRRWAQVSINTLQSRRLIDRFHFPPDRVFTIGTGLDPAFFRHRTPEVRARCRAAMSCVLGGDPVISATPVEEFVGRIEEWMTDQRPVVFGHGEGRVLDLTAPGALVLLQPTRIVERKRIWKDWELVGALLQHAPFREAFESDPALTLTLQVSGPVPIEHRECLETVIDSYREVLAGLPDDIGRRIFLAMSAGCQSHPTLAEDIDIVDIYQLADLVVFPSQTEGRGLPIVEASAAGVPIICSRYEPHVVFDEVVGERLPDQDHIEFEFYPEEMSPEEIDADLLDRITEILLEPASQAERIEHNRVAVRHRFSFDALQASIESVLAATRVNCEGTLMHICFIEDTYLRGGTQIWVSEAVRVFLAAGHDVTVLTAAGGFNAVDTVDAGARAVTYDFDDVTTQDEHHRAIWTEALAPADVAVCTVHPPRDGFHCSLFAARCLADAGLDTVLEPKTGTIVPEYLADFYAPPYDIRSQVISITDFTRRYLIDTYGIPADRVSLIYQGTDVAKFTPDASRAEEALRRYPLPEDAFPVLGCVGSFEERKGQVLLLEALAEIAVTLPGIHLMFVGDGPDENMLRGRVSDLGLERHVTFFPFTTEPADVFEVIDVLVLPSTHKEGLPNVLLEALAMGVPVVSSRLAGTPEAVIEGVTGLLVDPGDVAGLAAAIGQLGGDDEVRRSMGAAGARLMRDDFDKRRQFDAFLRHFAEVSESN